MHERKKLFKDPVKAAEHATEFDKEMRNISMKSHPAVKVPAVSRLPGIENLQDSDLVAMVKQNKTGQRRPEDEPVADHRLP